jgi:hypothetical protein
MSSEWIFNGSSLAPGTVRYVENDHRICTFDAAQPSAWKVLFHTIELGLDRRGRVVCIDGYAPKAGWADGRVPASEWPTGGVRHRDGAVWEVGHTSTVFAPTYLSCDPDPRVRPVADMRTRLLSVLFPGVSLAGQRVIQIVEGGWLVFDQDDSLLGVVARM